MYEYSEYMAHIFFTIFRAKQLFKELVFDGIFADVIHAERTKAERDRVIQGFREKKVIISVL